MDRHHGSQTVAGAFVGGLGSFIGLGSADGINISSIITATLGAFVLLFVYNRFLKKLIFFAPLLVINKIKLSFR